MEDYWNGVFEAEQTTYQDPKLVLFTGSVQSACGNATSQVGPFYCPCRSKMFIWISALQQNFLKSMGPAEILPWPMSLLMKLVITYKTNLVLHSNLDKIRQQVSEKEYNQYSVRLELQADYLAGTFAKYLQGKTYNGQPILEAGDIEEAITAANAIGDDTLQKEYQGYVEPDSFTHGTSKQRVEWFNRGFKYGDLEHGDTFNEKTLIWSTDRNKNVPFSSLFFSHLGGIVYSYQQTLTFSFLPFACQSPLAGPSFHGAILVFFNLLACFFFLKR